MSTNAKLYYKIKNNPRTVRFEDIDKLLTNIGGFERRDTKGSHKIYHHKDLNGIQDYINIPYKKPTIKPIYIIEALKKFELIVDINNI
ncbi:hypothetical protein AN1V17_04930 [Vallitalea sediminicola]